MKEHWFKDYKQHWGIFLLIVLAQAVVLAYQTAVTAGMMAVFFVFLLLINLTVAGMIMVLTWPVRRNFHFSRFIKILIAFAAVYGISQLIAVLVVYFKG